jgi:hypothetical protein
VTPTSGLLRYESGDLSAAQVLVVCRQLLRGEDLGALHAARTLGHHTAVLTLIGGGAFRNDIALIWESILWAVGEGSRLAPGALDVEVNGRRSAREVPPETLVEAARARRRRRRPLARPRPGASVKVEAAVAAEWNVRWRFDARSPRASTARTDFCRLSWTARYSSHSV